MATVRLYGREYMALKKLKTGGFISFYIRPANGEWVIFGGETGKLYFRGRTLKECRAFLEELEVK
jgi:hypothetical protein